ncbi:hypothetical protein JCM14202_1535 [Agrilactobacillus composti DSM 18527 = JCM 14202]|uniref:hypothetical protein n=1 Tax=Agrilactobacillus composti TaxID=398555 RepID=UPI00042E0EA1|nr:hypothetical protein [Agrilactobacillus composti]GAF39664.1 hypothetical protein JCM14202_1535 [Agrilactobacillus composti DSM 18527 = JCM 14202]
MEDQENQQRNRSLKTSLKAKWAFGMSLIILGTLVIFSFVIYYTVQNVLIGQERTTVQETLTAVDRRLSSVETNLTISKVLPRLNIETVHNSNIATSPDWDQTDVFQDSVKY